MAQFVKYIPLYTNSSGSSSGTYGILGTTTPALWDSSNYDGTVATYFEVVLRTGNADGTAYAALYDMAGNEVSGSEVTTVSTTNVRLRSSAVTLVDDTEYVVRIKNGNSRTTTVSEGRIVVSQSGTITKTETQICVSGTNPSTTSTSYVDISTAPLFLYDADQYDGTVAIYFEAVLSDSGAGVIANARLVDSGGTEVASSPVGQTGTTDSRQRSSALTLVDGETYRVQYKSNTAGTVRVRIARLIIVQTGSPTKSESYNGPTFSATSTSTTGTENDRPFYWDNDEWSVDSKSTYWEGTIQTTNASHTATLEAWDGAAADASVTSTSTSRERQRSASFTPDDNTDYDPRLKISNGASTATMRNGWFITQFTWTNPSGGTTWPGYYSNGGFF